MGCCCNGTVVVFIENPQYCFYAKFAASRNIHFAPAKHAGIRVTADGTAAAVMRCVLPGNMGGAPSATAEIRQNRAAGLQSSGGGI